MPTSRLKSYVVGLRALQPPFTDLHISRFGKVPKSNQPRKWRLILDLASPDGHSVNDGISKTPFSLYYVIDGIMARGRGTDDEV